MTKKTLAVSVWWLGVVISVTMLWVHPHRHGAIDWSLDSPFDNTHSGQAEQWIFLRQAARHVPRDASFTILAADRDTEMSLFMMAVGLLPEARPLPSSYYGQSAATGERARFVLEFGATRSLRPLETHPVAITGGGITERCANGP